MGKITPEVRAIIEKHQYDRKLRKYSDMHFFNDNKIFGRVNSNRDVESAKAGIYNRFDQYKKVYPLVRDDIEDLERAAAHFEIAARKVIQNFDNPNADFNFTAEELQELIDSVFECQDKVSEVAVRKAMQD
ncbi:hypothetical protein P4H66_30530 [Paenibacillus dokdonensis]|uniref:Uncharacterized protein n=1 Tax=Paenibacillus dokdonensis TaxID=2567944 RepID=A0ABU6GXM8_9BACL|nr:hypothetical protein [Paenibacillus dokdonensis]MEC0244153.1 hypothetical protein [Paenibacillus dokdonensis]